MLLELIDLIYVLSFLVIFFAVQVDIEKKGKTFIRNKFK